MPYCAAEGTVVASKPSRGEIAERIVGRMKAKKRAAEACMPIVLVNRSIAKPESIPNNSSAQPGISIGKINIKNM